MTHARIALLGFGSVGRALAALLESRRTALRDQHGIEWTVTGIATRRDGFRASPTGMPMQRDAGEPVASFGEWLSVAKPTVVIELLPLDPTSGEPALSWSLAALRAGAHVVSANKGPFVHGYDALVATSAQNTVRYRCESAVMDGAPVFNLVRHCLPLADITAVRGVFTSTATVVLEAIEQGGSVADGIAQAQRLGIAEADPSLDVDGWDSAMKLCALSRLVFGEKLSPNDVQRSTFADLDAADVRRAAERGAHMRYVGTLARETSGVRAHVAFAEITGGDPLALVRGTTLVTHYSAVVFPGGLTVASHAPDTTTTAYGVLADLIDVLSAGDHGDRRR